MNKMAKIGITKNGKYKQRIIFIKEKKSPSLSFQKIAINNNIDKIKTAALISILS